MLEIEKMKSSWKYAQMKYSSQIKNLCYLLLIKSLVIYSNAYLLKHNLNIVARIHYANMYMFGQICYPFRT